MIASLPTHSTLPILPIQADWSPIYIDFNENLTNDRENLHPYMDDSDSEAFLMMKLIPIGKPDRLDRDLGHLRMPLIDIESSMSSSDWRT